ncbi:MAG: hypothetical protein Q7R41_05760, partial [Phycisphaerales bacterium]|nr:hypothetical protein [Phycisphaerales bacterium]
LTFWNVGGLTSGVSYSYQVAATNGTLTSALSNSLSVDAPNCQPLGACCASNGTCQVVTQTSCSNQSGCYRGNGSSCSPNNCINLNGNPQCSSWSDLGSISGDTGSDFTGFSNIGFEAWYRVQIREDSTSSIFMSAWVELQSGPNNDYDLYVYCASCGGTLAGSSINGTGLLDRVKIRWDDDFGFDDDGYILIQVRWASGSCGGYDLAVYGDYYVETSNCDQ